jgi:hypothetical protein
MSEVDTSVCGIHLEDVAAIRIHRQHDFLEPSFDFAIDLCDWHADQRCGCSLS